MKPHPLDSLLRSVPEPIVPEESREAFAQKVLHRLRSAPESGRNDHPAARLPWNPFRNLASGFATASALAIVGWGVHVGTSGWGGDTGMAFDPAETRAYREVWKEFATLFPNQVRAVTFGPEGPRVILSDRPDLPETPGILVRLCSRDGCRTALTVSGQSVELGTQRLEVLGTARGEVFVTFDDSVWPLDRHSHRLSALNLESLL
jgi:hypothetical protein